MEEEVLADPEDARELFVVAGHEPSFRRFLPDLGHALRAQRSWISKASVHYSDMHVFGGLSAPGE